MEEADVPLSPCRRDARGSNLQSGGLAVGNGWQLGIGMWLLRAMQIREILRVRG